MRMIGYRPCLADPDVWFKEEVRPDDGSRYYAYMLLYVDDCLAIHHDAEGALKQLDRYFQMKPGSIGDPKVYLGAKLKPIKLENGVVAWAMSPSKYIQEAVANVQKHLKEKGLSLARNAAPNDYSPELDVTEPLGPNDITHFQSQIGILRWMVEMGRVDIIAEVSLLASHLALPRVGHLEAVYRIFCISEEQT